MGAGGWRRKTFHGFAMNGLTRVKDEGAGSEKIIIKMTDAKWVLLGDYAAATDVNDGREASATVNQLQVWARRLPQGITVYRWCARGQFPGQGNGGAQ